MIHATLQFGRSFSEDRAKEIAFSLLDGVPSGSWSFKRWYDGIWNIESTADSVIRPRRARLSAGYSDIELPLTDEQKDQSVRFRSLAPGFASLYGDDKARWVNVLRLHTYASDQSLAVVIPTDAPQEIVARMRLGGDGAAVSREGLLLPQHFKTGLPLSPVRAR